MDIFPGKRELFLERREMGGEKFLPQVNVSVLLVESDDATRQIITALLRKCNYRVSAVSDGLKAWETLKDEPQTFDLVLTEVDLPSVSGYALLSKIMEHEICKNIPVIVMSLKDSMDTAFKCLLKGAADFLFKPIRKNELQNLWQHVWRRHLSDGLPREMNERNAANLGQKNVEEENERIASIDLGDKGTTDSERGLDIQNSGTRLNIKSENDLHPDCLSSSACNTTGKHMDDFGDKSTNTVLDAPCSSQESEEREDKPFPGLDLIGAMDNRGPTSIDGKKTQDDEDSKNWKFLELSLETHQPLETENQEREDFNVLNHSSFSAFSRYSKRASSTEVVEGSVDRSTGSIGSQIEAPKKIEPSTEGSLVSSVISHLSSHREEALKKYRLKRKDRCFEKKVQYSIRKTSAEKRPRLNGHFARLIQPLDAEI